MAAELNWNGWPDSVGTRNEDEKLRAWFVGHDGFSEFKGPDRHLAVPIRDWEAERGKEFLIVSRENESGWVHITLGQRMSPKDAEKDIAAYPWQSEMQEMRRHRDE